MSFVYTRTTSIFLEAGVWFSLDLVLLWRLDSSQNRAAVLVTYSRGIAEQHSARLNGIFSN